jgi:hypothetical protein
MTARSTTDELPDASSAADDSTVANEVISSEPAPGKVTRARATTSGPASVPASARAVDTDLEVTRADRIEITQGGLYSAEAGSITVRQGGMSVANAETIEIRQGGIMRARATDIAVSQGGVGIAQGDKVSLDRGMIGAAFGGETRLVQSMSNVVMGNETTVDQSIVGAIVGSQVTVRQPSAIGVLIAGRVNGSIRPILDWRGAAAFGAVFAVVYGIVRRARR